ncbi:TetR family transcriptional regulator [Pacificibacter maritimus]|uniref:TetR family transcriptional regulator n=1 Tax=Pacificibacter maritimus TaxID=762213 RepID=A0A3N4ULZ5_9RHOB|nr:TetR/AcrR family transcriptional regulator [Pacificibacter maritimus]RPE71592.1 TetR family transcriptional regulator [Pacificibacter maritimus]
MASQSKRARGRPRADDADAKIARILSEAAKLFAMQGFNKTSFASVATAVGMTLPGLTHYFPSKIGLLLAVLEDRDAEMFSQNPDRDPHKIFETLAQLMARDLTVGAQMTQLFRMLSAEAQSDTHPAHAWFKLRNEKILSSLSTDLSSLQRQGIIRSDVDCQDEAISILAMMEGLQLWWTRMPDTCRAKSIFDVFLEQTKQRLLVP